MRRALSDEAPRGGYFPLFAPVLDALRRAPSLPAAPIAGVADELLADTMRALHAKQGGVKFLGSYPAAGDQAASTREHADARWREADDWVAALRSRVR